MVGNFLCSADIAAEHHFRQFIGAKHAIPDQFELAIDSVVNVEEQLDHQSQATKHWNKDRPDYRQVEDGYGNADSSR